MIWFDAVEVSRCRQSVIEDDLSIKRFQSKYVSDGQLPSRLTSQSRKEMAVWRWRSVVESVQCASEAVV